MSGSYELYPFDEDINRRDVPALKYHPTLLGHGGADLFAAGVADMDFKAPPPVLHALQERLAHGVFGYEAVPDGLLPSLTDWLLNVAAGKLNENRTITHSSDVRRAGLR